MNMYKLTYSYTPTKHIFIYFKSHFYSIFTKYNFIKKQIMFYNGMTRCDSEREESRCIEE